MYRTVFNENTKTWRNHAGTPTEIDPTMSCGSAILKGLDTNPDEIGQISDNNGVQLTNAQIRVKAIRAAQNLQKLGLKSGDVIQIITRNHHNVAPFVFGAIFIGAPVNALDVKFKKDEIAHILNVAMPKLILCDNDVIPKLKEAMQLIDFKVRHIYTFDGIENQEIHSVDELFVETHCENEFEINDKEIIEHPVAIICTSGTTSAREVLRKGISCSHLQMLKLTSMGRLFNSSEQSFLNFSSLYWLSGWISYFVSTLRSDLFLRMVEQYKVTVFFSPPISIALILQDKNLAKSNLSSIKAYLCAGGSASPDLISRMNSHLPNGVVMTGYGMTECGQIAAAVTNHQPNSVGQLVTGNDVKIVNEYGLNMGIGEEGEICVLPNFPMWGYYHDEENTKKAIDEFGWLHTGDIGYFDEKGTLYFMGRQKELLIYNGQRLSPTEIENIILKHPGVSSACVVGISDDLYGDLPAAVIVKNNVVDLIGNDIIILIRDQLSDEKQLRGGVYFVDDFPLTPNGKILRRQVQEIAIQMFNDESFSSNIGKISL